MLLDKAALLLLIDSLPDASPVAGDVVPKADLDAAQAIIAEDEAKIEKAKEDLA